MSVAAVAEEAGTTRQAVYRRWPSKAELGSAAMAAFADLATRLETGDPFGDLVAELTDFQHGVSRPGRLSLVGTMLQDSTDAGVRARYQAEVIAPRRRRLRLILERARRLGLIGAEADLEVALTMCTGSWYARALAGAEPPPNWPRRTAALVWRAVGGAPPPDAPPPDARPQEALPREALPREALPREAPPREAPPPAAPPTAPAQRHELGDDQLSHPDVL
jgi:AcrR family transcriptional regulator